MAQADKKKKRSTANKPKKVEPPKNVKWEAAPKSCFNK